MFLFCVLGILLFGSMYNGDNILKSVFIALLLAFLYACSDEYHQTFVVGRTGQFNDVLIDFSGAFIGVLIVSLIVKFNIFKKKYRLLSSLYFFNLLLNFENSILYMMIPIYPPKVFKIISSISQNLYGIKPWINSTPKVIINTAKRALILFFQT